MSLLLACLVLAGLLVAQVSPMENGLALTPPMGWLAWERFRCNIDCENDPDNCIHEKLFMQHADLMASEGYADVGYDTVSLDDCWMAMERDGEGKLQGDHDRFPSGIKALAHHIHNRGLKFGIYEDYGTNTCAGYPGIIDNMELDANTFAEWDVDYVKLDGCYAEPAIMDEGYPEFGGYLNKTGQPMVYSCSWPFYQYINGMQPNWELIIKHCNLWRNYYDIEDSWTSVTSIINYFGDNQDELIPIAGPGHWNDPDMLIIGNFGLSNEQSRSQMAIWAILAAPLLMSTDLRTIKPEHKAILQNKEVIAVNQDPLGIQGRRIFKESNIEYWVRPINPTKDKYYSFAIVFFSQRDDVPHQVSVTLKELGLDYEGGYQCVDLYDGVQFGTLLPDETIVTKVNPSGVVMVRCNVFADQTEISILSIIFWIITIYTKVFQIIQYVTGVIGNVTGVIVNVTSVISNVTSVISNVTGVIGNGHLNFTVSEHNL